jgi:hypothetical protein
MHEGIWNVTARHDVKLIRRELARHRQMFAEREGRPPELVIGILKLGGHGDFLQQLVFARAVRKRWGKRRALLVLFSRQLRPTRAMVNGVATDDDVDMTLLAAAMRPMRLDNLVHMPLTCRDWRRMVTQLARCVDVLWDVQYVAAAYWRDLDRHLREQVDCDRHLKHFSRFYSGFPRLGNPEIHWLRMTQWELLAESSGLDVREDDLELAPPGTCDLADRLGPYVTIHNGAGGTAFMKRMPPPLMDAVAAAVRRQGLEVVQLGKKDDRLEPPICGARDLRGLPMALSMSVVQKARLHVDVEGGLVYVARGVRTPSCVFFGPTSPHVFRFESNYNTYRCDARLPAEPVCEPCWWSCRTWAHRCPKGHPWCRNMPQTGAEAAEAVTQALQCIEGEA